MLRESLKLAVEAMIETQDEDRTRGHPAIDDALDKIKAKHGDLK